MKSLFLSQKVHGALLLVSAIYGFFYVAVKLLLVELSPECLLWLRFAIAALIMLPFEWAVFKTKIPFKDFLKIAGLGLLGVYLVQVSIIAGVGKTTSFHAALMMASVPIITLFLGVISKREQFHWRKFAGMLLGFAGVAIVLSGQTSGKAILEGQLSGIFEGNLYILLAAVSFALFLLLSHSLLERYRAYTLTSYCYLVAALAVSVNFKWSSLSSLSHLSTTGVLLIAFIILGASVLTYLLNNYALKRSSPTVVAVYMFLAPVQSAIWGYFILGEPFTWLMGFAALLTFTGITLANQDSNAIRSSNTQDALVDLKPEAVPELVGKS